MATDFLSEFRDALLDFLAPLGEAAADPAVLRTWLAQLGHTAAVSGAPELAEILGHAGALRTRLAGLDLASMQSMSGLQSLLESSRDFSALIKELRQFGNDPARATVAAQLGEEVMALLLGSYLRRNHETLFRVAAVLTLIDAAETSPFAPAIGQGGAILRNQASFDQFNFDHVQALLSDPGPTLKAYYFPNGLAQGTDAWLAAARLFGNLGYFANAVGLSWRTEYAPVVPPPAYSPGSDDEEVDPDTVVTGDGTDDEDDAAAGDGSSGEPDDADADATDAADDGDAVVVPAPLPDSYFVSVFPGFRVVLLSSATMPGNEVALELQCSSSSHPGATPGYILSVVGTFAATVAFEAWKLTLTSKGQVPAFVLKPSGFGLVPSAVPLEGGTARLLLERLPAAGTTGPAFVLGSTGGTRLEVGTASVQGDFSYDPAHIAAAVSAKAAQCAFVINPGDGDGFVSNVLPQGGLKANFDLGLTYSSDGGLSIQGGAGMDVTLPIGLSLGGVLTIPTAHLSLLANGDGIQAEISASVGLSIGPVHALIDRIGVLGTVTFPEDGGNFGPIDFDLDFKPPSGVGLTIDSAGLSGGGMLSFYPAKHEYSGMLQLQYNQLALQAFGLITTQVAGGDGYSLLALIDAKFPPVQLGWGFTLNGVGGLMAVHRSASVDALRAALKADQLGTILFPKNAITNAPQVLGELDALFPTAPERFLFGPMALIGWGTPTVLTAAVAVIVELPEPIRILLLARVSALLPSPSSPVVKINMDALGMLDLAQGQFSLDAMLFDSRLAGFTLTGDMALRANWGVEREFLLAIGGFHPRFTPPADFPALQRITVNMPSGKIAKMRLLAYLAITSNTVQFGAELDVALSVAGCGLSGHLGFDALLQLSPFHFEADVSGKVAITVGGDDLASVGLEATLTGPAPWNIAGKFTFHILWWDVSKSFSESWGQTASPLAIAPVDVGQLLRTALADPRSWSASLPAGAPALVTTRQVTDPGTVRAHPWARLEVVQRIVPLGLDITRFGQAAPAGAKRFALTDLRVGGAAPATEIVQDDFAPAQFFDLSDEQKLARPSFERHDAGLRVSGTLIATGTVQAKKITYETFYVDEPGGAARSDPGVPVQGLWWSDVLAILENGAAGRAAITQAGDGRYPVPGQPIKVAEPTFVIVDVANLVPAGIGPAVGSNYSDMQALLDAQPAAQRQRLQIVATHELAAAA